ncbi:MAG TPA: endonuclease/exonuclease/phosphatase family protein [Ideonella sp.]|nr:endonuclease/exonuclease/phosphatase family protein [Ideonella sp.]
MNLKTLSIATFNLYNLNEPGLALYSDRDGWTEVEYGKKIAWTAAQLTMLEADVVGFQELWHKASLAAVVEEAGLTEEYDVLAPEGAVGKSIVCGAIVRKGLLSSEPEWISDFPEGFRLASRGDDPQTPEIAVNIRGFSRPVLHFTIRPRDDEPDMHMYVCHFKSKQPAKIYQEPWYTKEQYARHARALGGAVSTIRRTAEAAALRFLLNDRMKGNHTAVVVMGDINDGQMSNTANILTDQPAYLVGDSMGGGDVALYTAQTLQEYRDTRDVYYTHVHQDFRESLDHILVSEQLYDNSKRRTWLFDGLVVNNDHLNFDNHKETGTNDHGLIRALFKHKPIKTDLQ